MKKLSIPEKLTLRWELVPGIGGRELRRIFASAVPGALAAFLYAGSSASPSAPLGAVAGFLIYFAACWGLHARLDGGQSMYDYLTLRLRFQKGQQKYYDERGKEALYFAEPKTK